MKQVDEMEIINNKSPHVVFVWSSNPEEGAPHQIMAALWMVKLGYRLVCVGEGQKKTKSIEFPLGRLTTRLMLRGEGVYRRIWWHLKLMVHLFFGRIGKYKSSIFYIQGHSVTPAALLALIGIERNRIVYHTQDFLEPRRHRFWEFFERRLACRAGTVVLNEPNRSRFMESYYSLGAHPIVVRTALPIEWTWPKFDLDIRKFIKSRLAFKGNNEKLIIHFGPLTSVRCGLEIAIAISRLPSNYLLVLTGVQLGSPVEKYTQQILKEAGIESRTFAYPKVSYDDLQKIGAACDIGLLLYPDDGIGNYYQAPGRLSEYLRCGLAVLLPKYQNMELLNFKYEIGAVCDTLDIASIAAALINLGERDDFERKVQRKHNIKCAKTIICYDHDAKLIENRLAELIK